MMMEHLQGKSMQVPPLPVDGLESYTTINTNSDEKNGDDEEEDMEEQLIKAQRERIMGMRTESAMYFMSSDEEEEEEDQAAKAGGKRKSQTPFFVVSYVFAPSPYLNSYTQQSTLHASKKREKRSNVPRHGSVKPK